MILVKPAAIYVAAYVAAIERGWSPSTNREDAGLEQLHEIRTNQEAFLKRLNDPEAERKPVRLPDGSMIPRLPGFVRWMWDDDFAGTISLYWQPGTVELPPDYLGHIGYSVVPWKRRLGYATEALRMMLPEAHKQGLAYVEIVTGPRNIPSQRVIIANGGTLVEHFRKSAAHGSGEALRFRIVL